MDPPLVNQSSFSATNSSAYSFADIWPFSAEASSSVLGVRMSNLGHSMTAFAETSVNRDGSVEESTVTEQSAGGGVASESVTRCRSKRKDVRSEDESSNRVSANSANDDSNIKRIKLIGSADENSGSKSKLDTSKADANRSTEQSTKPFEPPKQDYVHVRARRGQATDSHSLAERARREKISERMKILQDLVPGCNKVIGKALVLDEIINYIQSLEHQVEFLSMKLEAVSSRMHITHATEGFPSKDLASPSFDASGMILPSQALRGYVEGPQLESLHMQLGGSFERAT